MAWRVRSDGDGAAYGFLDGDFLERFLTIPQDSETMRRVVEGASQPERLTQPLAQTRQVLEVLRSLHR